MLWWIDSREIKKGQKVLLAPFGTERDSRPCLVFHDPGAVVAEYSKVEHRGKIVTAKTERGLRGQALRLGLQVDGGRYLP